VSRRPARFTQADVTRAIRAAKQAGAGDVIVAPDGSIVIRLSPGQTDTKTVDDERIVPL
jgi:pantoate kinase